MRERKKCKYISSSEDSDSDGPAPQKRNTVAYVTRGLVKDLDEKDDQKNKSNETRKSDKIKTRRLVSKVFESDEDSSSDDDKNESAQQRHRRCLESKLYFTKLFFSKVPIVVSDDSNTESEEVEYGAGVTSVVTGGIDDGAKTPAPAKQNSE